MFRRAAVICLLMVVANVGSAEDNNIANIWKVHSRSLSSQITKTIIPRTPQNRPARTAAPEKKKLPPKAPVLRPKNNDVLSARSRPKAPVAALKPKKVSAPKSSDKSLSKRGRADLLTGNSVGMQIIEAGFSGRKGPVVHNGLKFCPRTWTRKGISIKCLTKGPVHHVHFFINGHIERTEVNHPYTIAGDKSGEVYFWVLSHYGKMTIGCETQTHDRIYYDVDFSCPKDAPPPPYMKVDETPPPNGQWKPVTNPSPSPVPASPENLRGAKKSWKKPAQKKTWKKPAPTKKPAQNNWKKPAPKPAPKQQTWKKPAPVGKTNNHWNPGGPLPVKKQYCVAFGAKGYRSVRGGLGQHAWVHSPAGMVYKPNFTGRRTFGAQHWLEYGIKVPKASHYGLVIEMTTKHWTEHNDVWLSWKNGRGFRLRKGKSHFVRGNGWTKAYHNKKGRAKASFSVDFRPHSFSTADILWPGTTYVLHIAGRSSKVTIHRVIMFPCKDHTCHSNSGHWQNYLKIC